MVAAVHAFFCCVTGATLFIEPRWASPCRCVYLHAIASPQRRPEVRAKVARLQPAKARGNGSALSDEGRSAAGYRWDSARQTIDDDYVLEIPRGLSLLTAQDPNATVIGLEEFPRDQWPNVRLVHWLSTSWSVRAC